MSIEKNLDDLYQLIQEFVSKQDLAKNLMVELRPDLMFVAKNRGRLSEHIEEWQRITRETDPISTGTWGAWRYLFHGLGCRLTHLNTGEPIDWDAPNVDEFDLYKLSFWLEWKLPSINGDYWKEHLGDILDTWVAEGKMAKSERTLQYRML